MTPEPLTPLPEMDAIEERDDHIVVETEQKEYENDITSGKQQASATPLSLYMQKMGEMQVEAMEKLFASAVDAPCSQHGSSQKAFASDSSSDRSGARGDTMCHAMLGCQQSIEYQLDILTHCRQPLEFFPFLHHEAHHQHGGGEGATPATVGVGMYTVPLACEYCGSSSTNHCEPDCQRPKLYMKKKRPPFANKKDWDPVTEYQKPPKEELPGKETLTEPVEVNRKPSWVAGLFGSRNSPPKGET